MKKKSIVPLSRFSEPDQSPGFLLWKVSNAWQRKLRTALQPLELTHSQFVILATATWFEQEGPLTQARLSELAGIDPMTTSQIVRTLISAQLIHREKHPGDPRANWITVTASGRDKAKHAVGVVEQADSQFFEPISDRMKQLTELFLALGHNGS